MHNHAHFFICNKTDIRWNTSLNVTSSSARFSKLFNCSRPTLNCCSKNLLERGEESLLLFLFFFFFLTEKYATQTSERDVSEFRARCFSCSDRRRVLQDRVLRGNTWKEQLRTDYRVVNDIPEAFNLYRWSNLPRKSNQVYNTSTSLMHTISQVQIKLFEDH